MEHVLDTRKRPQHENQESEESKKTKVICSYGEKCYRKISNHFQEFEHPHLDELLTKIGDKEIHVPSFYSPKISDQTLVEQLGIVKKLKSSLPEENKYKDDNVTSKVGGAVSKLVANMSSLDSSKESEKNNSNKVKEYCSYGDRCYRKTLQHFKEYEHPHLEALLKEIGSGDVFIPSHYKPEISNQTLIEQLRIVKIVKGPLLFKDKAGNSEPGSKNAKGSTSSGQVVTAAVVSSSSSVFLSAEKPSDPKRAKEIEMKCKRNVENNQEANNYRLVVWDRTKNKVTDKLEAAAPYNFFLTTITNSPETHNEMLSISFPELLDPTLGDLESSLQLNFMVEFGWLVAQYHIMGHRGKPLTLVYGEIDMELGDQFKHFLTHVKVKPPSPFGSHHTKMMVFAYKDGSIRIVVSTANLVESDWDNRTQGLWVSGKLRQLAEKSDTGAGESPTFFKRDFIRYLSSYRLPQLQEWITKIKKCDFSSVMVFLISSTPGNHTSEKYYWGQLSLASVLTNNLEVPDNNSYPVIVQCSSIGSLGDKPDGFLTGSMLSTFCSGKKSGLVSSPPLHFIYPCFENVANSYDGLLGGGCLPYSEKTHMKQEWLNKFLCQWKSESRYRTRAPPHIKTYCRVSPDLSKLSYFLLTSANMSKAAWGKPSKAGNLNILSYEAGVLFIPKFLVGKDYFPIKKQEGDKTPLFPLPYDLPVTPYRFSDVPWFWENLSFPK